MKLLLRSSYIRCGPNFKSSLFQKLLWCLGNWVSILNARYFSLRSWHAVLRWKNGLWSSAILASESEAEHPQKRIITRKSKQIEQIKQQSQNHWIITDIPKAFAGNFREIFSAWLCVSAFILAALRIGSCQVQSIDPGLESPANQARTKKTLRRFGIFFLYFLCVCVWSFCSKCCVDFIFVCFRIYFCMFGFMGNMCFFVVFQPGRGTRALGFPGRFGSADRSHWKSRLLRRSVTPWRQTKTTMFAFLYEWCAIICWEQKYRSGLRFNQLLFVEWWVKIMAETYLQLCFQDLEKDPNACFSLRSIHAFEWRFLHAECIAESEIGAVSPFDSPWDVRKFEGDGRTPLHIAAFYDQEARSTKKTSSSFVSWLVLQLRATGCGELSLPATSRCDPELAFVSHRRFGKEQ